MPKSPPLDFIRPMFEALKELDEFTGIRFGHQGKDDDHPSWQFLDHSLVDGIGGFAKILRQRGAHLPILPQNPHDSTIGISTLFQSLPGLLRSRDFPDWQKNYPTQLSQKEQAPLAYASHGFSEEDTQLLINAAKKQGVTVNSLLLHSLDATIRSFLKEPKTPISWMVPVNLRGLVWRGDDESNHSSYLTPRIEADDDVHAVHDKIRQKLDSGAHLLAWKSYSLTQYLSSEAKKTIIRKNRVMADHCLGCFSNLGIWDPECHWKDPGLAGRWFFSPPTLRCQKIAAGCLTFQKQLTLTLQIHPELAAESEVAREWMQSWLDRINLDEIAGLKS